MTKYSTDSGGSENTQSSTGDPSQVIKVTVNDWLKEALDQVVQQSDAGAREAIRRPLEYAIIEWNREFERNNKGFDIPGEHIWEPDFRCIECMSSNKFLFRKLPDNSETSAILCLNCEESMSMEEVTKLARATKIQNMDPLTLGKEGTEIRHEYEGEYRSPMRYECKECKERGLILPDPEKIDALICPQCGNKGEILSQIRGPKPKGFSKYPPDKYHEEPSGEPVGRGISRGEYDELEKSYSDGYEK